jgi:hypothetical protein
MDRNLRSRLAVVFSVGVVLAALVLGAASIDRGEQGFTETALGADVDGGWYYLQGSPYVCVVWGTFSGGATFDAEILVAGTQASPTKLKDVGNAALVGVTAETTWQTLDIGGYYIRAEVTGGDGSTSVNWRCGKAGQ